MRFKYCLLLFPSLLFAELGYVEPWGETAEIALEQKMTPQPATLTLISRAAENIIRFHQKILSPTTGPRSHFRPSSSQYALEAIREHGFLRGVFMGCDRLMRENPDPWVYTTRKISEKIYKWDPPPSKSELDLLGGFCKIRVNSEFY